MTLKAHLLARNPQHSGNISPMRIVAGNTGAGGKRPMDKAALELVLLVTVETKRFRCLQEARKPSLGRDLMAKFAQVFFRQQAIHF